MPVKPEETGKNYEKTFGEKSACWMEEIDEYILNNPPKRKYTFTPKNLDYEVVKYVAKKYNEVGWNAEAGKDQRDGIWLDLIIK